MDINFFKETRILDGGMGQELLARGMEPNGTLWSANALLKEKYHQLLLETHIDFIKAGAEVIVTTTFTTRKIRLRDNKVEDKFEYLNTKAGEIAQKAKKLFPKTLIAGGLPPQYLTYEADTRSENEIKDDFYSQAKILNPYVDFFYFDVLSSVREFKIGIECIKEFEKPYLIGAHISEGTKLPSGEKISEIVEKNFKSTGLFNPLKKDAFVQKPDIAHLKPRFEDWRLIKAQALVTGKLLVKDEKLKIREINRKKSYDLDYSDNNEEVTKQLEALDVENSSKN